MQHVRLWGFRVIVLALSLAACWRALTHRASPARAPLPTRTAHHPSAAARDGGLRNPFLLGAEWRAMRRERDQVAAARLPAASPMPSASPSPSPAAQEPELTLLGTLITRGERVAILSTGYFLEGKTISGFKIESVGIDRVMLEKGGLRFELRPGLPLRAAR